MRIGYKTINGFIWPEDDIDCASVTFRDVVDLEVALKYCKSRRAVVQAGGNAGVWPRYLLDKFGVVYTFEPEPASYHCLHVNCPGAVIFNAALGAERGLIGLEYPEGRRNMGAVCVNGIGNIPLMRLDDMHFDALDLIQLDIEGYEPWAIKGAFETIRKHKPVIMLEDKGLSVRYNHPQGWPLTMLGPLGYTLVDSINRDVVLVCGDNDAK